MPLLIITIIIIIIIILFIKVYVGIRRWLDNNEVSKDEEKSILKIVRLELIPMNSLLGEVRESSLFEANDILDAIAMINKKNMIELNQRGLLCKSAAL